MESNDIKLLFKTNMRKERQAKGWSHHTLAKKANVSEATIKNCETRGVFSPKTVAAISRGLDIDPWVLFLKED